MFILRLRPNYLTYFASATRILNFMFLFAAMLQFCVVHILVFYTSLYVLCIRFIIKLHVTRPFRHERWNRENKEASWNSHNSKRKLVCSIRSLQEAKYLALVLSPTTYIDGRLTFESMGCIYFHAPISNPTFRCCTSSMKIRYFIYHQICRCY